MAESDKVRQRRLSILEAFGASEAEAGELIVIDRSGLEVSLNSTTSENLPDEPFVSRWRDYCSEVADRGSLAPLAQYLIQLQFPVKEQISQTSDYINATRRGVRPCGPPAFHDDLNGVEGNQLFLHQTIAGAIPVIVTPQQKTFRKLVCALAHRNEPVPIPQSMGAILITRLNNWDRVALHRREHLQSGGTLSSWPIYFQNLKRRKELYQDSLIIIREGGYSGLPAAALRLEEQVWDDLSLAIRLEHECVHYVFSRLFHLREFGLIDELIADYLGVVKVFGTLPGGLLSLFFGVEGEYAFRRGGRLENYRHPREAIFSIQQRLCRSAIQNLEEFHHGYSQACDSIDWQRNAILALASFSLEELAGPDATMLLLDRFSRFASQGTYDYEKSSFIVRKT